ncbi:diguanylate cyclase [Pseudidiomarina sp.]|uniref:sensor domain-containing diguanylate cyclase n=1 Tax=Pseudidiomarina sp. TaxID=2081707 RepID=UPI003A98078C
MINSEHWISHAPVGLIAIHDNNHVVEINDMLLNLLGYQRNELIEQSINLLFSRSGKLFFLTHVFPLLQHHGNVDEMYLRLRDKKGNEVPVLMNATAVERDGKLLYLFAMMPIQRRFIFEDQLLSARIEAEQAFAAEREATDALELAQVDLEAKQEQLLALNEQLQRLATTDEMTQLDNRRSFEAALENHLALVKRDASTAGLLLLDVDHFKQINDGHGHSTGDEVLGCIGKLLRDLTRDIDTVARVGGEEFAVIVPNVNSEGAFTTAERIRHSVQAHTFKHGQVTVSIGVTMLKEDDDRERILSCVDRALYQAKHNGRNCIVQA